MDANCRQQCELFISKMAKAAEQEQPDPKNQKAAEGAAAGADAANSGG